ncbi:MAG: outer-membrane lipoprotein carrier protein LolA [Candidatus Kapabacteria bacterium]|nr:outer-membrane lipoprotein carrier protein LolA [Candidatus Kapabacteria bacterium]
MKKIFLIILIFTNILLSQNDKNEVFNSITNKFKNLKTISIDYISQDGTQANIKAKKGDKYIINLNNRIIYNDGKTIWNYNIKENNVIINSKNINLKNQFTIDDLFFDIINNSKVISLKSIVKTNFTISKIIEIEPNNKSFKIDKIEMSLNSNNEIKILKLQLDGKPISFVISDIKVNLELNDKLFKFVQTNKETEMIDMR